MALDGFHHALREHVAEIEAGCARLLDGAGTGAFAADVRHIREAGDLLTQSVADLAADAEPGRIAHKLRNPLTALLGYSEFLREDARDAAALELDRIHEVAERLLRLVDEEFG